MQPLIDGDVILYEIGFAAEAGWQQEGYPPFDYVMGLVDNRIGNICGITNATEPPIIYFTGKTNFRYSIAKTQPYKDRPSHKPWHYKNIKAYLKSVHIWDEVEGLEADDLMAITQTERPNDTIICTRDKDLLNFSGFKYCWELGNQAQFGPELVSELGTLSLSRSIPKRLRGTGGLFFYSQCLTGDKVDSVPGLPGVGSVKAFNILSSCESLESAEGKVLEEYIRTYGEQGRDILLEQARLLNMTKKRDGRKILLWNFLDSDYEEWYDLDSGEIARKPRV